MLSTAKKTRVRSASAATVPSRSRRMLAMSTVSFCAEKSRLWMCLLVLPCSTELPAGGLLLRVSVPWAMTVSVVTNGRLLEETA